MSKEQAKAFRDFIGTNEEVQKSIGEKYSVGETIDWPTLGAEHGFEFTNDDTEAVAREMGWDGGGEGELVEGELSDAELETVSGGGRGSGGFKLRHSPISMAMGHNRRLSPFSNDFATFKGKSGIWLQ